MTRGDCVDGPRPCPYIACRQHLWQENGGVGPDGEPGTAESCALDIADRGDHTLEEVASAGGFETRERVRLVEASAFERIRSSGGDGLRAGKGAVLEEYAGDGEREQVDRQTGPNAARSVSGTEEPREDVADEDATAFSSEGGDRWWTRRVWHAYLRSRSVRKRLLREMRRREREAKATQAEPQFRSRAHAFVAGRAGRPGRSAHDLRRVDAGYSVVARQGVGLLGQCGAGLRP